MQFFQITKKDPKSQARLGIISTAHGPVQTPAFLPIGTKGSVKAVTTEELKFWGAEMILANTYHLWLRPGDALIHKAGGLHKFIGWDGPIFTDSGGFQVYSLGEKYRHFSSSPRAGGEKEGVRDEGAFLQTPSQSPPISPIASGSRGRRVSVTEAGVEFQNELDGLTHNLTPEASIQIQSNLGSDIALVLDDVPGLPAGHDRIKKSLELTLKWARRAKVHHQKITSGSINPGQRLFGIVQGGDDEELRKKSAEVLQQIGFDGYGIGGLAVGEDAATMYKVLRFTTPLLEEEKPRHLLGVGYPEQIIKAVGLGVDTFDCVLPTRNARHGELFVAAKAGNFSPPPEGKGESGEGVRSLGSSTPSFSPPYHGGESLSYTVIKITNEQYKEDFTPVDNTCNCYGCTHHNRAYLRHLFAAREPLAVRLATMHNLRFYLNLMAQIRRAIEFDGFSEMLKEYAE